MTSRVHLNMERPAVGSALEYPGLDVLAVIGNAQQNLTVAKQRTIRAKLPEVPLVPLISSINSLIVAGYVVDITEAANSHTEYNLTDKGWEELGWRPMWTKGAING